MKRLVSRRLWVQRSARFTRNVPCGFFLFIFGVSVEGGGDSGSVGAAVKEEERTP